jgi:antitoxin VapB
METQREVRLFRNGRNQAVRIPREFELPGNQAVMRKEGDRLIIEPARRVSLTDLLASWQALPETFPDVDKGLGLAEPVDI